VQVRPSIYFSVNILLCTLFGVNTLYSVCTYLLRLSADEVVVGRTESRLSASAIPLSIARDIYSTYGVLLGSKLKSLRHLNSRHPSKISFTRPDHPYFISLSSLSSLSSKQCPGSAATAPLTYVNVYHYFRQVSPNRAIYSTKEEPEPPASSLPFHISHHQASPNLTTMPIPRCYIDRNHRPPKLRPAKCPHTAELYDVRVEKQKLCALIPLRSCDGMHSTPSIVRRAFRK
jgi:hypothetical protein